MTHPTEKIARDSSFVRNVMVGLVLSFAALFSWCLLSLNADDRINAANDVKWAQQDREHSNIESFEKETAANIASINGSLIQIRDDIAAIRRELGNRNLAASTGKEPHGNAGN